MPSFYELLSDERYLLVGKPEGRDLLEDPGVYGKVILKWILEMWDGRWTGST
jgi:hypothetical protein